MTNRYDLSENVKNINAKISSIQTMIDGRDSDYNIDIRESLDELRELLKEYNNASPTENDVADDLNFALSKQSMTIEEREELLNTKLRQIDMSSERNTQTKNMLTVFIIINIVVLLAFIGLIVLKSKK